jgi:hypothetical protein
MVVHRGIRRHDAHRRLHAGCTPAARRLHAGFTAASRRFPPGQAAPDGGRRCGYSPWVGDVSCWNAGSTVGQPGVRALAREPDAATRPSWGGAPARRTRPLGTTIIA